MRWSVAAVSYTRDGTMVDAFKERFGEPLLRELAHHLGRVNARFPRQRFLRAARAGLQPLEMKARVHHVAQVLASCLPTDFCSACDCIEAALAPPRDDDDLSALSTGPAGLAGWAIWPLTAFVAQFGLAHVERALRALHALTQRFTAEFALRPFLHQHPEATLATLRRWSSDRSPHVRRLVSEGSRPRLPWGEQLPNLIADPAPLLPLLRALQDDPSDYVTRSVANHLNDIAKDHPHVVEQWLSQHLPTADARRLRLLRHAARTLIKQGNKRVLAAFGVGRRLRGTARLRLTPNRAVLGEAFSLQVTLQSNCGQPQALLVDYVVRRGTTSRKVWKGWKLTLAPMAKAELSKRHSLRATSVRRLQPGKHCVELQVNGDVVATASIWFQAQ